MLFLLSWRNIWRNKSRSFVLMLAIGLGIWAGIVATAFFYGMTIQRTEDATRLNTSHIQVHHPDFLKDPLPEYSIQDPEGVFEKIKNIPEIKSASPRIVTETMVANAHGGYGVNVLGVDAEKEIALTGIDKEILEGKFLDTKARIPVVVGKKLADKMKLKIKSEVVISFLSPEGQFVPLKFKVNGIFRTKSSAYDETTVFVRTTDIRRVEELSATAINEIAILTEDYKTVVQTSEKLKKKIKELEVLTWKELSPEMGYATDLIDLFMLIFMGIIMLALAFGILNTMQMAVMERTREIGMCMSLGMSKPRIFAMIVLETIFLGLTATPFGLLIAYGTVEALKVNGVDLSIVGEGMAAFGIDTIVFPEIPGAYYFYMTLMVFSTAVLTSVVPALRAIRLSPAEATRKI